MASRIERHIQSPLLDIQGYLSEILTFLSSMGWSLRVKCLHAVCVPVSTSKVAIGYSWQILADTFQILSYVLSHLLFAVSCICTVSGGYPRHLPHTPCSEQGSPGFSGTTIPWSFPIFSLMHQPL